ncbi:hypothetical protein PtB15_3B264 [Puccinia triticina]|nr:hypothetical protein PtB15_3B264 [Puccinia triticina]
MVVGLGIRQSDASELTPTIWALIDCRSDPPELNLLGVGPDEFESECLSHFKSLSRLSISNLANPPNQEDPEDCHGRAGPELIQIPNRSLPPSAIGANHHKDSSSLRTIKPKTDNLKTLLMVNIPPKSSRDSPVPPNHHPLDLNFKYPTSPSPARSITTPSSAHMTSLVNPPPSTQSIIPPELLPALHRAHSSPRPICSPLSLAGSPQFGSEPSSSPLSSGSHPPQAHDKSPTPPSSPHTHSSSPSNCQTCRFPLSRASSQSSFLLGLSYRSPLFDDFDEEGGGGLTQEASLFDDERPQVSRQPSICSSSPDSSSHHPLSTWWSDLPPHRRAHIIEAESWPIFTPSAPLPILGSPLLSGHCACSSLPSCELPSSDDTAREPPKDSSSTSLGSRPSFPTNLNLLIPTPLDQDETDPLLSAHPAPGPISPTTTGEPSAGNDLDCAAQLPTRKKKPVPRSSESLLTKSLRRLSRKLPNIQWGNLSVRMHTSGQMGGPKRADGEGAGEDGTADDEQDNVLPSGVVDEDPAVELLGDDEKAQISRLVKSWTLDNIQPQNSLNGSFIVDPEMEWSSMMVQLETFSPDSNKKPHKLRTQTERQIPRRTRAEQHSRRSGSGEGGSTAAGREGDVDEQRSGGGPAEGKPAKRAQSRKRLARNQQHKQRGSSSATSERKQALKFARRVVSNPLHLLQLTLELEMMRNAKIKSPLKQRSMKLVLTKLNPNAGNNHNEFEFVGSPLRFEI